jgi:hypothetical protein
VAHLGTVRTGFERALADPGRSGHRLGGGRFRAPLGADYVRVTLVLTVVTTDVADALMVAWDAFRSAARRYRNSRN